MRASGLCSLLHGLHFCIGYGWDSSLERGNGACLIVHKNPKNLKILGVGALYEDSDN